MVAYPLIGSYDLAITRIDKFVKAPQFKGGNPVLNRYNQIHAFSGGYSVVYPINVNGKKLALRCWLKDPGNVKERYTRVKPYLASNTTSYFVDFGYVETGILADGNIYPVSYMDWIEGKTLSQFIDENIRNTSVISELAGKFLTMVKELHAKRIAHGDLQDGNIIVCKNTYSLDLKLVDYDCIYTPTLQNGQSQDDLQGVPDYQHPKRYRKANEKADYFSELVIYLSLLAYAEKPSLWQQGQEKRLLFVADDFSNLAGSSTFRLLEMFSPQIRNLADRLKQFCHEIDTNRLIPLEQVITNSVGTPANTTNSPDSLENFFGSTPPPTPKPSSKSSTATASTQSSDLSSFFGSSPVPPMAQPNVSPPPFVTRPIKQPSKIKPLVIMAIIIAIILALLVAGSFIITIINTQNALAQPIYSENFSYPGQWEWSDADANWDVNIDIEKLIGEINGQVTAWTFANQSFQNVKIVVTVEKISGIDNNSIGLICNAADSRHFYAFIIGSDTTYNIVKLDGDNFTSLLSEWKSSNAINGGNAQNIITAICNNGNLSLSVNGIELASVYDTSYGEGDIGLIMGLYEAGDTKIYFDDLQVYPP
jgi:serine/threonine protein kinase